MKLCTLEDARGEVVVSELDEAGGLCEVETMEREGEVELAADLDKLEVP